MDAGVSLSLLRAWPGDLEEDFGRRSLARIKRVDLMVTDSRNGGLAREL